MLSRAQILAAKTTGIQFETVEVPEFGGPVTLRPMSAARRDRFEQACLKDPGNNPRARLFAYSACDAEGNFLFDEGDVAELGELPASALSRISTVAFRLNGMGPKDVDELEKN